MLQLSAQHALPTLRDIFLAASVSSAVLGAMLGTILAEPVTYAIFTPTVIKENVLMFVPICMKLTYKTDLVFLSPKRISVTL